MTFLVSGFLLGLAGSLHCVGMCGPLALVAHPPATFARRPSAAQFLVHQAGRISIYVVLGTFAGWTGAAVAGEGWQSVVAIVAGLLLVGQAVGLGGGRMAARAGRLLAALTNRSRVLHVTAHRPLARAAAFGAVNGLLPCGLLYAALVAAAGFGSLSAAVAFMGAFGLGSVPALAALVTSGRVAFPRAPRLLRRAAPVALAAVGLLLIARGLLSVGGLMELLGLEDPGLHLH
jgi:hypothetical protein